MNKSQSFVIYTVTILLHAASSQYTEIWTETFNDNSNWICGNGGTWNIQWTSSCHIPYSSGSGGCQTGTCGLMCAVSGNTDWWFQRTTTISSYSALYLQIGKIKTYNLNQGEQCQIWYSYDGANYINVLYNTGGSSYYDQPINLGSTGSASILRIKLQIHVLDNINDCNKACYFDNIILSGILTTSPTNYPTTFPTKTPTNNPSIQPTFNPTTNNPTIIPTNHPNISPTNSPSNNPSNNPTDNPSKNPTYNPSISPTNNPSQSSNNPTNTPSKTSYNPSIIPTNNPSIIPSNYPTDNPLIISEDYVSTTSGKSFIDVNNSNDTYQLKLILISVVTAFICCVAVIGYVLYKKRKQNEYKSSEKKIEMTISPETAKTVPQTSPRSENELIKHVTETDESAANNLFNIIASNIDSDNNNGDDGIYGNSYITPNGDDAISINGHKYKNSEGVAKEVKIIEGARVHTEGNKEVTSDVVEINGMQNNENIDENDDSNILLEKENHEQEIFSNEHNKDSGYNFEPKQEEDIDDNLIHMNVLNNDPENEYNDNVGIGDNLDFIHGIMIYEDDVDKNMKTRQ